MADRDPEQTGLTRRSLGAIAPAFDETQPLTRRVRAGAVATGILTAGGMAVVGLCDPSLIGLAPLVSTIGHVAGSELGDAGLAAASAAGAGTLLLGFGQAGLGMTEFRTRGDMRQRRTSFVSFFKRVRVGSVIAASATGLVAAGVGVLGGGHAVVSVAEVAASMAGVAGGAQAAASLYGIGLPRPEKVRALGE